MRKYLFYAFFALISFSAKGQLYKSRAILLTTTRANDTATKERCNILMVYSVEKKRMSLYNPDKTYDLVEFISEKKLPADTSILCINTWMVDQSGVKCEGMIFTKGNGITGFNVYYDDVKYSYFATPLD
jgi:hypothetical protein